MFRGLSKSTPIFLADVVGCILDSPILQELEGSKLPLILENAKLPLCEVAVWHLLAPSFEG